MKLRENTIPPRIHCGGAFANSVTLSKSEIEACSGGRPVAHRIGGVVENGRARREGDKLRVLVGDQHAVVRRDVFLGDAVPAGSGRKSGGRSIPGSRIGSLFSHAVRKQADRNKAKIETEHLPLSARDAKRKHKSLGGGVRFVPIPRETVHEGLISRPYRTSMPASN